MNYTPPFTPVPSPRPLPADHLPSDLRDFYTHHEGVGLESDADRPVRLCRLDELSPVTLRDLHPFRNAPLPDGWHAFSGFRIGMGTFFDELVYVTRAPACPPGSIMAFGADIAGPGGAGGPDDPYPSLVLAATFDEWITRLRTDDWEEYALVPGEMDRLPAERAAQLRQRLAQLNPRSPWAQP